MAPATLKRSLEINQDVGSLVIQKSESLLHRVFQGPPWPEPDCTDLRRSVVDSAACLAGIVPTCDCARLGLFQRNLGDIARFVRCQVIFVDFGVSE